MTGTAIAVRGDARALPLPDNSIDLIVTSPPYFGLRSYQDGGEHYHGQIGSEPTPAEFLAALWACTAEWVRVLKPEGSLWVNLGDKYSSGGRGSYDLDPGRREVATWRPADGARPKSLLGIPWRYAIGCIDRLGLILRAEVIWSKPNGLPESVTDRVRRSHEQWFHLVKQPRYYSAVDEIREATGDYRGVSWSDRKANGIPMRAGQQTTDTMGTVLAANPLGKLPGSVWTVPTEPLTVPDHLGVDHFAAFPLEWPRRIIAGWSPPGICTACGQGRRPVVDRTPMQWRPGPYAGNYDAPGTSRVIVSGTMLAAAETRITGYVCACPTPDVPTRPSVVVDPFGGTGTTALAAKAAGRTGISVDLSHDYSRLAAWRTSNKYELAKAMQLDKPPIENVGQLDLLEGLL